MLIRRLRCTADIHSSTLGLNKSDDSLERVRNKEIHAELAMVRICSSPPPYLPPTFNTLTRPPFLPPPQIFGKKDNHVPSPGRTLIRSTLDTAGAVFSFYEFAWAQHAFIRDELSKGRYDPAVSKICFEILLELFYRRLKLDLGEEVQEGEEGGLVC